LGFFLGIFLILRGKYLLLYGNGSYMYVENGKDIIIRDILAHHLKFIVFLTYFHFWSLILEYSILYCTKKKEYSIFSRQKHYSNCFFYDIFTQQIFRFFLINHLFCPSTTIPSQIWSLLVVLTLISIHHVGLKIVENINECYQITF